MNKVYVATVVDRDTGQVSVSVHTTKERAIAYLGAYCRGRWEDQGNAGHLSADDKRAIDQYFEYWDEESTWTIRDAELNPEPAHVDQSTEFRKGPADPFYND